jgi:hypothetical protein
MPNLNTILYIHRQVSQTNSIRDILWLNKKLPIGTNPNPSNKKLLKDKILLNSIINQVFRYLD